MNKLFYIFILIPFFALAQPMKQLSESEIKLELQKLNTLGSVLYIAAHPDDENTRLLSYLANERKVRTAYLSLTRGDGGQNLIGNEQGELLGMIRTQELLEARKLDGAEQFFTRAYDFGFSKNPDETFEKWNKEKILEDVVYIIRKFKPDVIITRFPTTGEGGHGHHTASAILAVDAFDAAADAKRFPEQVKEFGTWQAKRLVWNTFNFSGRSTIDSTQLRMSINNFNPLLGKSYGELAAESRSMHKSQGFGSAKQRNEFFEYFKHLKGSEAKVDVLEGVETNWGAYVGSVRISELINKSIEAYNSQKSTEATNYLLNVLQEINKTPENDFTKNKKNKIVQLLLSINGVWLETLADRVSFAEQDSITFTTTALKRISNTTQVKLNSVQFSKDYLSASNSILEAKQTQITTKIKVKNGDFNLSNPFWLNQQKEEGNFIFDKSETGFPEKNECLASYSLAINGKEINYSQKILFKVVDPVDGESYKEVLNLPAVTINLASDLYIFSTNKTVAVKVEVKNNLKEVSGKLQLKVPDGFTVSPQEINLDFKNRNQLQTLEFVVSKTGKSLNDNAIISAEFMSTSGSKFNQSVKEISYKHIKNLVRIKSANAKLVSFDVKTISKNIGYIEGAGDDVKESLGLLNYNVTELTNEKLKTDDLTKFDAIVVGIRAYNTHEWMAEHYTKLMKYVENGGNLIVQYNTNNFISNVKSDMGPFPFKISRERVTIETAPIKILNPKHAIVNSPNPITDADFNNWVQERGIYFASDFEKNYTSIFSCNDPNEKEQNGSLIVCDYGKGHFVYTGLAFFRQLPAGVSGAYRLFVNCIEYGKK
jgi:LmbE family N-acetylglucosaminyl deacetylase